MALARLKKVTTFDMAARRHQVPVLILWGVYGIETGFGTNVKTSSAGAMGHMQFIPSTAKAYGYPLTNNPTQAQFDKQIDAAAKYLSDLHRQHKSWDVALRKYSGGGYGLSEVKKKIKDNPAVFTSGKGGEITDDATAIQEVARGPVGDVAESAFDGMKAVGAFFLTLLQADTWLRIGKVVGGAALLYLALIRLGAPLPSARRPRLAR